MRLLAAVGFLALVPALVLAGMRFAPSQSYVPAAQMVGLFAAAFPLALIAALLLGAARLWWPAGIAVFVAVSVLLVVGDRAVDRSVAAENAAEVIRVGAVNAYYGRADASLLAAQLQDLDIACVSEATPPFVEELSATGMSGYHAVNAAEGGASGTILYSRWEMSELAQVVGVSFRMPRAVVTTPTGAEVTVTCAHPAPPTGTGPAVDLWERELRALRDTVADTTGSQVVMGDFNATWDHRLLRDVASADDLHDAAIVAGEGLVPTWPMRGLPAPAPFVAIDHVLTDLDVVAASIEDVAGSDHRIVTATLQVPRSRP